MKPRRLDRETMVSRLATAAWTSAGSTAVVSVTGWAPMARGLGRDTGGGWLEPDSSAAWDAFDASRGASRHRRGSRSAGREEPVAEAVLGRDERSVGRRLAELRAE